jgi:hypothetical protein
MPDVKYIDANGYASLRRVREGTQPDHYSRGVTLGPPDLTLPLSEDEIKRLQEALVDAWLVNAELIRGSSRMLYDTVKKTLPKKDAKLLVRYIKSIYQNAYYGG